MIRPGMVALAIAIASPAFAQVTPSSSDMDSVYVQGRRATPVERELAKAIAARMMPEGTFQKVMGGVMDGVMTSVIDGLSNMPIQSVAKMAGQDPAKVKMMGAARLRDVILIMDPAFEQRFQIMGKVMGTEMGALMTSMEPSFREGLADAYVIRFDEQQLREIDSFFRTPTGNAFAAQLMVVQTDPAFMSRMQGMMPRIMEAMPAMMKKVEEATVGLPKQRKPEDLTADEKKRIAELLGTDPAKVKS